MTPTRATTMTHASAAGTRKRALHWFYKAVLPVDARNARAFVTIELERLWKSQKAVAVEVLIADPSRPEMADWARNMTTHLKALRAVIKKMRKHAQQAPNGDFWWKSDIRRPPEGDDEDCDTYLEMMCARIARAKDLRTMDAIGVLAGDPPPDHLARKMPALAALLDGAERIANDWPKVPRISRGRTTSQMRRRREAFAVAQWTQRILGKAAPTPADLALAEIAMGFERPCRGSDDFRRRTRKWERLIARERSRTPAPFRTDAQAAEDAKTQDLVDRAREWARTRSEKAGPTET